MLLTDQFQPFRNSFEIAKTILYEYVKSLYQQVTRHLKLMQKIHYAIYIHT
jgi:hypothetical protein